MPKLIQCGLLCFLSSCFVVCQAITIDYTKAVNDQYLPEQFYIYFHGTDLSMTPKPLYQQVLLATKNRFQVTPGCYIACYSHLPGTYAISKSINVMGQIRIFGRYQAGHCIPDGYSGSLSHNKKLTQYCNEEFPACQEQCWAGGDTGGWFSG